MRLALCLVGCALVSLLGWTLWLEPPIAPLGEAMVAARSDLLAEPADAVPAIAAKANPAPLATTTLAAAERSDPVAAEPVPLPAAPPAAREFGPWREVEPGVLTTQRWVLVQRADGSVEQKLVTMRARAVFEPLPGASRLEEASGQPPR